MGIVNTYVEIGLLCINFWKYRKIFRNEFEFISEIRIENFHSVIFFLWKSLYLEFTCIKRDQFNCCTLSFLLAVGKYSIYVHISTRYEEKVVWNFVSWKFRIKIGIFRLGYFIRFYYVKSQCLMQLEIQDRTFKPDEEVTETAVTKVLDFKGKK